MVTRDDALLCKHGSVGLACRDVLAVKAAIEVDRGVDLLHDGAGTRREAPAPHFVAHDPTAESPMTDLPDATRSTKRRRRMIALGALLGVAAGLAAVYGIGAMQRNPTDTACRVSGELTARLAPLARGEVAAINIASHRTLLPDLAFNDGSGKP